MTNVVLVRHEADYGFGNYLFETPVDLKKGQRVRVKTRRGESDATGLVVGDKVILLMASLAKFLVDLVIHGYSSFKMCSSVTVCMLSYTVPILNSLPGA